MVFDVHKTKGKAPRRSIILHKVDSTSTTHLSNTYGHWGNISALTSPTIAAFRSSRERHKMANFNDHGDHSTRSSNTRSKIVVLKVRYAPRALGRGVSGLSVSNAPGVKLVTIRAPSAQLAKIRDQKSRFQGLSTQISLDGNGPDQAATKLPDIQHHRSVTSVSKTGSPLRSGNGQSLLNSNAEQFTSTSKQQLDIASDFRASPADTQEILLDSLLSRGKASPPFHQQHNLSSDKQHLSLYAPNPQLGSSPASWRKRQLQLLQQLGLSTDNQQRFSSSQLNRQTWDLRSSSPTGPTLLKDLGRPLESSYVPPLYNSPAGYPPLYGPALNNFQPILPATTSAAFAAEGWNPKPDTGVYVFSSSAPLTTDPDDFETPEGFKARLMYVLGQMMFVSGETAEASPETTGMIEEIVRAQVIEMLKQATDLANRRGVRSISTADLIFLIRHDKAKVSRLKTFLSWKDVRKNVKDSDEKGGGDAGEVDFDDGANLPGAGPVDSKKSSNKKAKLILPWEVQSFYSEQVPEREDEEDNEEEEEQNEATLARLASADERTKNMTRDEYVYWSDCRQASFTFRKGKRFREWAGFGVVTDSKPNDDIVDILGFLTFEIVQTLTEEALKVKAAEDLHNARTSSAAGGETKKRKREGSSLFEMPEEGRTPVEPKHVREAFRRLQIVPKKYNFMRPGYMGIKQSLRLI